MQQPPNEKPTSTRNEGTLNSVKKVTHRKPPVIKQTLTSMYRIAKTNPLLVFKDDATANQVDDFGISNIKLPKSVLLPTTRSTSDIDKLAVNSKQSSFTVKSSVIKSDDNKNKQKYGTLSRTASLKVNKEKSTNSNNRQFKRTNSVRMQSSTSKLGPKCETQRTYQHNKVSDVAAALKIVSNTNKTSNSSTLKPPNADKKAVKKERRSLSAEHYDRKKGICQTKTVQLVVDPREGTHSLNDIPRNITLLPTAISPITEEVCTVTFKTPSAHKRRSISLTSITPTPFRRYCASTPCQQADDLQQRLEEWLLNHQKPVDSYNHLKCFGLHRSRHNNYSKIDEENKENMEEMHLTKSTSYEDLKIIPENSSSIATNTTASPNVDSCAANRTIAQDALTDLHKLILDGYPNQQCEAWLGLIRQKYHDLDREPQYWECRAAIEQTRGNITSAVECLQTAIVQGAEVKVVDGSLEQLLQKFSLLNISTLDQDNDGKKRKDHTRIVLDARNIFKSSIIKFAIQERTLKKKQMQEGTASEKKFIATPVRRSTRQNRSSYTLTPGVKLCDSLGELDRNICNSLDFHGNIALLDKLFDE